MKEKEEEKTTFAHMELYRRNAITQVQNIAAMKRYGLLTYPPEEVTETLSVDSCVGTFTARDTNHA